MSLQVASDAEDFDQLAQAMATFTLMARDQGVHSLAPSSWLVKDVIEHENAMGSVVQAICTTMAGRVADAYRPVNPSDKKVPGAISWNLHVFLSKEAQLNSQEAREELSQRLETSFRQQLSFCVAKAKGEAQQSLNQGDSDKHLKVLVRDFMTDCTLWDVKLIPMSMSYISECMDNLHKNIESRNPASTSSDVKDKSFSEGRGSGEAGDKNHHGDTRKMHRDAYPDTKAKSKKHTQIPYFLCITCRILQRGLADAEFRYRTDTSSVVPDVSSQDWESRLIVDARSHSDHEVFNMSLDSLKAGHEASRALQDSVESPLQQEARFFQHNPGAHGYNNRALAGRIGSTSYSQSFHAADHTRMTKGKGSFSKTVVPFFQRQ